MDRLTTSFVGQDESCTYGIHLQVYDIGSDEDGDF